MKTALSLILFGLLFFATGAVGEVYNNSMLKCTFDLPAGWSAQQATPDILIINTDAGDSVEVTVSRFELDTENPIKSDGDLAEAITGLYHDIGIKSANRDSIAYAVNGGSASFEAEYNHIPARSEALIHSGLKGIIGRLASGEQVLYLIVVMAPPEIFDAIRPQINVLTNSFRIDETLAEEFYPRRNFSPYMMILLILALSALFYSRNRRVQKSRNPLGRDSGSLWRCSLCGRANHIDNEACSRCGTVRVAADIIRKS